MGAGGKGGRADTVRVGALGLPGTLRRPATTALGVVVFAHGSGSSRLSPRNNFVASALAESGLASLLFDLLTEEEAADRRNVFDIELLARRLVLAADWIARQEPVVGLPLGYFGASTGAAAALVAAARDPALTRAVVSRGGRPDLAGPALSRVEAPTLLIVGGDDVDVLELNRQAARELRCEHRIAVVSGATHLFEESGTLEAVVDLARRWFLDHFAHPASETKVAC